MPAWTESFDDKQRFMDFFKWTQKAKPNEKKMITGYGLITVTKGDAFPIPMPLNMKEREPRIAECAITLYDKGGLLSGKGGECQKAVDVGQSESRTGEHVRLAFDRMVAAEINFTRCLAEMLSWRNRDIGPKIQAAYDIFCDNDERGRLLEEAEELERQNDILVGAAQAIQGVDKLQARALEGTIKNKDFVFYEHLFIRKLDGEVTLDISPMIVVNSNNKQFQGHCQGKCVVGKIVEKGTHTVTRKKYFKFSGGVSKKEVFDALSRTGWNMGNLKKPDDLEKVS